MSADAKPADLRSPAESVKKYQWVSRSMLYSAIQGGLLAFYRRPSQKGRKGEYLIRESEFLAWVESTRREGVEGDDGRPLHRG